MSDRALILSCDHYTIPDSKTGEINELYQLWYCNDYRDDSDTEFGNKPIKMLTTPEIFKQLKSSPSMSVYDLDLRSRPGKANAAALTVVGIKFVFTKESLFLLYSYKSIFVFYKF